MPDPQEDLSQWAKPKTPDSSVGGAVATGILNPLATTNQKVTETAQPIKEDLSKWASPKVGAVNTIMKTANMFHEQAQPENLIPAIAGTAATIGTDGLASSLGWSAGKAILARILANSMVNFGTQAAFNTDYVKEHPGEAALGAGVNAVGSEGVGQGIDWAAGGLRNAILRSQFPINRTPEDLQLLRSAPPNLPYTVGQAQGESNSALRENSYSPKGKEAVLAAQDAYAQPKVTGLLNPNTEDLIKEAANSSRNNLAGMKNLQSQAYGDFDSARAKIPPTVVPGKPITYTSGVLGPNGQPLQMSQQGPATIIKNPIALTTTDPFVDDTLKQLNDRFPQGNIVNSQLGPIVKELQYLHDNQAAAVPYDKIKQLHNSINDFLADNADWNHPFGNPYKGATGILANLNRRIGNDIDSGVGVWGGNLSDLKDKADNIYITKANAINNPMAQTLLKQGIDPKITYRQVLNNAFSSVEQMRQAKSISGDVQGIAELGMQRATEAGLDPNTGKVDAGKVLQEIQKPENADIYREAIPSAQRGNFTEFWKRMNAIQGSDTEAKMMQNVMSYQKGKMALSVPLAVGMAATAGHSLPISTVSGTGGVMSILGIQKYIGKMMTNPQVARALVEGTKIPSSGPAATTASRILLRSLAGATGLYMQDLTTDNSSPIPIEVDPSGKITLPNRPMSSMTGRQ